MSVANIASLASIQGKRVSLATTKLAKLAIFATDMLWESCLKFNLEQLSHSMSVANIASLAVARETYFPWSNYQYLLQTCYGKVVPNFILNIFAMICFVKIFLV